MIHLIVGHRGSGKTKRLIALVNEASERSEGNVVCVEKEALLTYDINSRVRLIDTDSYHVSGYQALYGFLSGICARDFDITDIFVDATLKIGGRDYNDLALFLKKVSELEDIAQKDITFTISADLEELPKEIFDYCEVI